MKTFDFSGWATKNDLKCSDGRTIKHNAFEAQDGEIIPLVWQHTYDSPENILGHVLLENRPEGVYCYGSFNNNKKSQEAKEMVRHEDLNSLSIYANELVQHRGDVIHGVIKEVSLVVAGANPGAKIEFPVLEHSLETIDDEAIIFSNIPFAHSDLDAYEYYEEDEYIAHADDDDETIQDVFDTLSDKQKDAVYAMLAIALEEDSEENDDEDDEDDMEHAYGGYIVKRNIFEGDELRHSQTLSHDQLKEIIDDATEIGSLKASFIKHAAEYGIDNIDILFPDAKTVTPAPDFIKRDTDWVSVVLNGTSHSPFSRIKSTTADITAEEARAKGYIKGNRKKEEVISVMKRVTTPTTIYKKQKLDRDDIIDITDLNVVSWLKSEMRMMLDEELARAILIGDGRDPETQAEDKINETCIRPIYKDDEIYAHRIEVYKNSNADEVMDSIIRARKYYKGSGNPILFTTEDFITDMLMLKDGIGRRIYKTEEELRSILRVSRIVPVEVMENIKDDSDKELLAILVNLNDYRVGADSGGQISMFDDFDIDYNQYKYLIETRCSGALIHPKSAIIVERNTTNKPATNEQPSG